MLHSTNPNVGRTVDTPCLMPRCYVDPEGYSRNNKGQRMHRLMWEEANGPIPEGMYILHACDNRACFNIGHLWLGTHLDNMADKIAKGRQARGAAFGRSRLTDKAVASIRERYGRGDITQAELAHEYGLHQTTVSNLLLGKTWAHVQG